MNNKILFILNPVAGQGRVKKEWLDFEPRVKSAFSSYKCAWTQCQGDAVRLVKNGIKEKYLIIVAVGGDGTLNECLNGLISRDEPLDKKPSLGILPFGRGSDLARALGIPKDPRKGLEILQSSSERLLDIGKATFTGNNGKQMTRYFLNIANIGIVPHVVNWSHRSPKIFGSKGAYWYGTLMGFVQYQSPEIAYTEGKTTKEIALLNMIIANGNYFGSGMKAAPEAKLDDGLFDILTVQKMGAFDFVANFPHLYTGKVRAIPQVHFSRQKEIKVVSLNNKNKVFVEMDGDTVGHLPASFEILPKKIRFKV